MDGKVESKEASHIVFEKCKRLSESMIRSTKNMVLPTATSLVKLWIRLGVKRRRCTISRSEM